MEYFRDHAKARVALLVCNKPGAGVVSIAEKEKIPVCIIEKDEFFNGSRYNQQFREYGIDFIALAGFLWKVPVSLIRQFPGRIVNIHPALLPKYGGKGMYGRFVHEAVIRAGDQQSGITVHLVDEIYDHGKIIYQASCPVLPGDDANTLAKKVLALEHKHYSRVIEELVLGH